MCQFNRSPFSIFFTGIILTVVLLAAPGIAEGQSIAEHLNQDQETDHEKTTKQAFIPVENGLILDLNADEAVKTAENARVVLWENQVTDFPAKIFRYRDKGREQAGSGRPTLKKDLKKIGGHNALVFRRQELVNHNEDAFDHLLTGSGYTWFVVISPYEQVVQLEDVNSFFGNLKNGGKYEGIWGCFTDENRVWIGSRNGVTFGRWDKNNPKVLGDQKLETGKYYLVMGRMGSGTGEVDIELFINELRPAAVKPFPVNPDANSSKMVIGQERDATNHPGVESFDGEIARFMIYERPLADREMEQVQQALLEEYELE